MSFTLRRLLRVHFSSPRFRNSTFVTLSDRIVRITVKSLVFVLFVPAYTKIIFVTEGLTASNYQAAAESLWPEPWTTLLTDLDSHWLKPEPDRPRSDRFLLHFIISDLTVLVLLNLNLADWHAATLFHPPRVGHEIMNVVLCVICIMCHLFFCAFHILTDV